MFLGVRWQVWAVLVGLLVPFTIALIQVSGKVGLSILIMVLLFGGVIAGLAFCLLMLYLAVAVHELGHYLAGYSAGARLHSVRVGAMGIVKKDARWQIKRVGRSTTSGYIFMKPSGGQWTNGRMRWFIAGGPLASLMLVLIAWLLYEIAPPPFFRVASFILLLASASVLPSTLLPSKRSGLKSDMLLLLTLHKPEEVQRRLISQAMATTQESNLKARDWDHDTVMEYARLIEGTSRDMSRFLFAYLHLYDRGDYEEGLGYLQRAEEIANSPNVFEGLSKTVHYCYAVAMAEIKRDAVAAREAYGRAEAVPVRQEDSLPGRTLASVLYVEGDFEGARKVVSETRELESRLYKDKPEHLAYMQEDWDRLEPLFSGNSG